MASQGIEFLAQSEIGLTYKGRPLQQTYRADLVCFSKVIVEIKAVSALTDEHRAQLMTTYAAPAAHQLQPLPGVEHERFVI